jgi:hypothetical protein
MGAFWLALPVNTPNSTERKYRQGVFQSNRKGPKTLCEFAVKPYGRFWVAMAFTTLAGFESFNAELVQNLDGFQNAGI